MSELFLKPSSEEVSGGRSREKSCGNPSRSCIAYLYSYRVIRRNVLWPPSARRASEAARISPANQSIIFTRSASASFTSESGGGISPLVNTPCTSNHQLTSLPLSKSGSKVSTRNFAFCLSGPWHPTHAAFSTGPIVFRKSSRFAFGSSIAANWPEPNSKIAKPPSIRRRGMNAAYQS